MREHPIPQDIVGYRFHIIGSMTIRQFAELAVGAIVGLIIYSTNLPTFIKWPLIFFTGILGAAAAFLPIEERPLDHWLTIFVQTLYRPTKFFWKKSSKIPDVFLFKPGNSNLDQKDEIDLTPARRQRIKDYLASVNSFTQTKDKYELEDQARLNQIMQTFNEIQTDTVTVTKQQAHKPQLKVATRSLEVKQAALESDLQPQTTQYHQQTAVLHSNQVAQAVSVPKVSSTRTQVTDQTADETQTKTFALKDAAFIDDKKQPDNFLVNSATTTAATKTATTTTNKATFNAYLPFPTKPTTPNKIVGMILTPNNELIPEAVVEIRDEQNRVVRAVKSNALGQFFINTPLQSGSYTILVKDNKYHFNPQEIVLTNQVVEPIEIRSLS